MVSSTGRNCKDKKRRRKESTMRVSFVLGILSVLMEGSSQDTNHPPRLLSLLNLPSS